MKIHRKITRLNRWVGRGGYDVEWITLHYTAGNNDTAAGNASYFANNYLAASAHFFVDTKEIWQSVELSDTAWHCGDNPPSHNGCINFNSVGIEMCSVIDSNGNYYIPDETVNNTAELVWHLLDLYPQAKLCRHYDVTGKECPRPWVRDESLWHEFQRKIKEDRPMTPAEKKAFADLKAQVKALEKALAKNTKADETLRTRVDVCENVDLRQSAQIKEVDKRTEVRWDSIDECPKWLKPTVKKLTAKGYLKGDGNGLGLTYEMGRILVIEDRAGVFDE